MSYDRLSCQARSARVQHVRPGTIPAATQAKCSAPRTRCFNQIVSSVGGRYSDHGIPAAATYVTATRPRTTTTVSLEPREHAAHSTACTASGITASMCNSTGPQRSGIDQKRCQDYCRYDDDLVFWQYYQTLCDSGIVTWTLLLVGSRSNVWLLDRLLVCKINSCSKLKK